MTPELQAAIQQAQQAQQQAIWNMKFFGYTSYAAIIICAIFAILIFSKLCQIQKLLQLQAPASRETPAPISRSASAQQHIVGTAAAPKSHPDDSQYMPKR